MQQLVMATSSDAISTDGRLARGERTRRKVADSLISLLQEGDPQPTAKAVAERAGVSLRLVFHHFEDMDALYRAVMVLQARRYWSRLRLVPPDLPVRQRIDRTVRQCSRLFEAISPVRRAAVPMALHATDIAAALAESSSYLRGHLASTFSPELDAAGEGSEDLLEAIDVAVSWETWERLRVGQGLSALAARRIVGRTLAALVAPAATAGARFDHDEPGTRRMAAHPARGPSRGSGRNRATTRP